MKTNITLLLPLSDYKKEIGKLISNKLGMFYADVDGLLKFELSSIEKALSVGGSDYLEKEENRLIKRLSSYNNALITIDFTVFNREENFNSLKDNSLIVYLKFLEKDYIKLLKKEQTGAELELNQKLFAKRSALMEKCSDVVVNLENTNKKDIVNAFLNAVNNYYN